MSVEDEKQTTEESGSPMVSDLVGLGKLADSKLVQSLHKDLEKTGATEQGGKFVTDTIKALRLFTAPIQLLALGQDLLEKRLERVRNKVPEGRQIEAHPQIAGPILQNLQFMVDGDILTEMYLNLLARAIDRDRVGEANPAFVKIIEQLCPDEALLLLKLRTRERDLPYSVAVPDHRHLEVYGITITEPKHYNMYITHLCALNLIRSTSHMYYSPFDLNNLPITDDIDTVLHEMNSRLESIRSLLEEYKEPQSVEVTEFGSLFIHSCVPEDFHISDWERVKDSASKLSSEESS